MHYQIDITLLYFFKRELKNTRFLSKVQIVDDKLRDTDVIAQSQLITSNYGENRLFRYPDDLQRCQNAKKLANYKSLGQFRLIRCDLHLTFPANVTSHLGIKAKQ